MSLEEGYRLFGRPAPSGVDYRGLAQIDYPVLPFQVFGLAYGLDLVVVAKHPQWTMHEFARVDTPAGPLWFAKEADAQGRQRVIADDARIHELLPEVDVPRYRQNFFIDDRSQGDHLDYQIRYTNSARQPVELRFRGRRPSEKDAPKKRNGNTMGHSRQSLLALLDISRMTHAPALSLNIGGRRYGTKRLFGIYSMAFVLEQTQGGLSRAAIVQKPQTGGFLVDRGAMLETWRIERRNSRAIAVHEGKITTLTYEFLETGDSLELAAVSVTQAGRSVPVFEMSLNPALPDLRRPFQGAAESRFMMRVNGEPPHGLGRIFVHWEGNGSRIEVWPQEPSWIKDRPMMSRIALLPGGLTSVVSDRIPAN
ncbi:MAG: hypothetical protein HY547_02125 [Elusimicrobia bacterium]|nr:hypothetical protein [Elusimicrobiota bacterium]